MVDLKRLPIIVLAASIAGLTVLYLARGFPLRIDTSFATKVTLRYHYVDKTIDTVIMDADDVKALKEILAGPVRRDAGLSCGFDPDVSITLTDGRESIVFCPACDGCEFIRIHGTDRYVAISDKQRKRFDAIVRKYGMTFPCV